jgi:hypothetical protein
MIKPEQRTCTRIERASAQSVYWISIGIFRCHRRHVSFLSLSVDAELLTFDCAKAPQRGCSEIIKALSKNARFVLPLGADGENKKRNNFYGKRADFLDS